MASVDWKKLHSAGEVKAVLRHDCTDSRTATATHANEDIRRDMTATNTGILDGYDVTVAAYDARMADLPAPTRKDAVVGLGFSIPLPNGLPSGAEDEWAEKVYSLMSDAYGQANIVCYVVHRDEQHEYIDPDSKARRVSRPHIQGVLVPESDGRLCAKEVTARARMQGINKAIQTMTQRDYGLDFMDGSKAKSRGSVETMKQRSAKAELEERIAALEARNAELEEMVDGAVPKLVYKRAKQRQVDAEKAADAAEQREAEAERHRQAAEETAAEAIQRAEEARRAAEVMQDRAKAEKAAVDALRASMADTIRQAETLRDYFQRMGTAVTAGDRAVVEYLRSNKAEDGRTLYAMYSERAANVLRRVAKPQYQSIGALIEDAKQRANSVQNTPVNRRQRDDGEMSL